VASSDASDFHAVTSGGVKLYVQPNADGWYSIKAFGAIADGSADDTGKILTALAAGPVDGGGSSSAVTEVALSAGMKIRNAHLVGISPYSAPIRVGTVGSGAVYNNSGIVVRDLKISGVGSYACVFANMTDFEVSNVKISGFSAANDIFYFHRMYAGSLSKLLCFGGSTAGANGAVYRFNLGVNGLTIDGLYTSCFVKYGLVIDGDCASLTFNSPVLQGHSTAFDIVQASGIVINAPYTENCVNPFVIGSGPFTPRSVVVQGAGYISGFNPAHIFATDDNKVMILLNRGASVSFNDMFFSGVTSSASGKRIASVNNGSVLTLRDALTASGDLTEVITNFLYRQPGAAGTSGYYVEDTGAGGHNTERTTIARNNQGSSSHVIRYRTTGTANFSDTAWTPAENV
jgi:hypothetical protein